MAASDRLSQTLQMNVAHSYFIQASPHWTKKWIHYYFFNCNDLHYEPANHLSFWISAPWAQNTFLRWCNPRSLASTSASISSRVHKKVVWFRLLAFVHLLSRIDVVHLWLALSRPDRPMRCRLTGLWSHLAQERESVVKANTTLILSGKTRHMSVHHTRRMVILDQGWNLLSGTDLDCMKWKLRQEQPQELPQRDNV